MSYLRSLGFIVTTLWWFPTLTNKVGRCELKLELELEPELELELQYALKIICAHSYAAA